MDPPYGMLLEQHALAYLADSNLIRRESTRIIIEARLDEDFAYLESMGYKIEKKKLYKTNQHIFVYRENEK